MSPTLAGGFFTTEPPGKLPPTIHFFDIAGGSLYSDSMIFPELIWAAVNSLVITDGRESKTREKLILIKSSLGARG